MEVNLTANFKLHKRGNAPHEYEDAFKASEDYSRVAVADGATEASFSMEWAGILVDRFIEKPVDVLMKNWDKLLAECRDEFYGKIRAAYPNLPWHAELKLEEEGSFSSLVVVNIDTVEQSYSAFAVGDSCSFLLEREGNLLEKGFFSRQRQFRRKRKKLPIVRIDTRIKHLKSRSHRYLHCRSQSRKLGMNQLKQLLSSEMTRMVDCFPIRHSSEFNNRPLLVGSLKNRECQFIKREKIFLNKGVFRLYMMTDALALWFMKRIEAGGQLPWEELDRITSNEQFEDYIEALRDSREMKNDDVTLVILDIIN